MNKPEVESILLANLYLIKCKLDMNTGENKIDLARKFLTTKINKALVERSCKKHQLTKAL